MATGPSSSTPWLYRFSVWVVILLGCLVSTVMARRANSKDTSGGNVQVALASATALLVGYWMTSPTKEETKTEYPAVNKDKTLIWREDEGISKLVPLHPRGAEDPTILKKYTMAEVAKRDSPAEAWIIIDERVYDITNFVAKHPGGELVLYNMAGKDCTDAFANYHQAAIYKKWLPPYLIGQVTDVPVYPHVQDFRDIRQELLRKGLFETNPVFYYKMYAWYATLFFSSLYLTLKCQSTAAHMLGAAFMGMFWQQLAGWGHDMGHSSITHNCQYDNFVGSTLGCAILGFGVGWWKRSHNTHHVVCNSIENDPDIQHMPLMAVTPEILKAPFWSTYHKKVVVADAAARFFVSYQHWFFPLLLAAGRFNLYALSWILPLTAHKQDAIVMHNIGMDTYHGNAYNDESDEWYKMQIKTTMNVDCYEWLDWFHIGLQFQTEHHLYPTLPRHNLRIARLMAQQVCKKHGIQYNETTFFQGVIKTVLHMRATALECRKGTFDYQASTSLIRDLLNANG
ncbi:Bifunctional delta 6-fatty acyl acetylenase/desaturase [Seminavis robusta]|uniref:Bifunctional delta 6-fatty acyl acetylenase/desaturase n=1 Tax=Seminavis robusta TaxID=568900 RepID=A0A9N8E121_9STRA|nr:Bifunctional delta 6-fatty acyl acetylenase/desaturase [Seminavis robusta]|eukprot:Sro541_g163230.1 Bifunctional delta 6-fatty acyl acetylenase/desaturase (511) ;mRNA; r:43957-45639